MSLDRKYSRRENRTIPFKSSVIYKLMFWLVIIAVFFFVLDSYIRPTVTTVAVYQAKVFATDAINTAVSKEIEENGVKYDNLVTVNRSADGELDSVECDMGKINMLKSSVTNRVSQSLENMGNGEIKIPVGTLFGGRFLSGYGPKVPLRMLPAGYVHTEFKNSFDSAGINQTRHTISVEIAVNISILIPGYPAETEVKSTVCIAETVIVGKVPQGYTDIEGDNSDVSSKVNDYGAFDVSNGVDIGR